MQDFVHQPYEASYVGLVLSMPFDPIMGTRVVKKPELHTRPKHRRSMAQPKP